MNAGHPQTPPTARKAGWTEPASLRMFPRQKRGLAFHAPAVTGKVTARANHPVTWDSNRDFVVCTGACHSPHSARGTDLCREFLIGDGFSGLDSAERVPHLELKGCSAHMERQAQAARR